MSGKHTNRVREHFERAEDEPMTARCMHATEDAIRDNPVVTTLALFGIGLSIGVFLGRMLGEQMESYQSSRRPRMQRWFNSMSDALPEAVRRHVSR
jgi:hypothetical protein